MTTIRPVIMCGGSGTRLWPVSRASMPKQFQSFSGAGSLLQETVARVSGPGFAPPLVVGHQDHRFLILDQLRTVAGTRLVLEPFGRNTAAVALAASLLVAQENESKDEGALILLLPSDHLVTADAKFRRIVTEAVPAAQAGAICLFGVVPDRPETGYGYIEVGSPLPGVGGPACAVSRFVEKPARPAAEAMLAAGGYLWNAGIFLFSPAAMLREAQTRRPDLLQSVQAALDTASSDDVAMTFDATHFGAVPSISLDYALIEGSANAAVVPLALDWSDLGAWDAVNRVHAADPDGNVVVGRGVAFNSENTFIRTEQQLVATVGVKDLLVVATLDAVLVADKSQAQAVKPLLDALQAKGFGEATAHALAHRPWGTYRSVIAGDRFQVKLITVKPGGRLSLQRHCHRAEHWVVVHGSARITCGEKIFMLYENQSSYIPQGEMHRLENPGKIPLELIEVQSGPYLGEDDIERFDDVYGRS